MPHEHSMKRLARSTWELNEWMNKFTLNDQNVISIFYSEHEKSEHLIRRLCNLGGKPLNLSSISDWNYSNSNPSHKTSK